MLPVEQLRRIPADTWHRFQRILEPIATALIVLTRTDGGRAVARMAIHTRFTFNEMHLPREVLWQHLDVQIFERGAAALLEVFEKSA